MSEPVVSFYEDDDASQITSGNPLNLGSVGAGEMGSVIQLNVWNNKGGSSDVADMTDVKVTTVTNNGYYTGDTVANGKEVVENQYIMAREKEVGEFSSIGGSTVKDIGNVNGIKIVAPDNLSLTAQSDDGLLSEDTYYYVVSAVDETGETLPSGEQSVEVSSPDNQVELEWDAVPGATGYRIYRSDTSGVYGESSFIAQTSSNEYVDKIASPGSGTPKTVASNSYGHKREIQLRANVGANATSGLVNFKVRVLYRYTE